MNLWAKAIRDDAFLSMDTRVLLNKNATKIQKKKKYQQEEYKKVHLIFCLTAA